MLTIWVNGETKAIGAGTTLAQFVAEMCAQTGRDARGIAIERNREIVPKSLHAATVLEDGDRLEIVQFVGGG